MNVYTTLPTGLMLALDRGEITEADARLAGSWLTLIEETTTPGKMMAS